jgi:hypothetical protein
VRVLSHLAPLPLPFNHLAQSVWATDYQLRSLKIKIRKTKRKKEKSKDKREEEETYRSILPLSSSGIYLIVPELDVGRKPISSLLYIPSSVG